MQHIGKNIKSIIAEKKYSAKDIASQLGVSYQHLYRIFASESVESRYLISISEILNVPVSTFFNEASQGLSKVVIEEIDKLADQNTELRDKLESRQAIINLVLYTVKQIISKYERLKQIHGEPEFGPGDEEFEIFINDSIESLNIILSSVKERKVLGLDLGTNSIGWSLKETDKSGKTAIIDSGAYIKSKPNDTQSEEKTKTKEKSFFKQPEEIDIVPAKKISKSKSV